MSEHTKEPWHIRELRDDCFITAAVEPGMAYGPEIMGDDYTGYGDSERKKADARRIVACVNACEGVPTADLEQAQSPQRENLTRFGLACRQRDELLQVLIDLLNAGFDFGVFNDDNPQRIKSILDEARAAIVKAR